MSITPSAESTATSDPSARSAASWQARYAALKSRQVDDSEPRVAECLASLSYWRLRRTIEAEVASGLLTQSFADTVLAALVKYPETLA